MWLVATFFGLAATYALLYAHFLAALQVLVYAGAIMVLFIFVVMVLNRDESEPYAWKSLWLRGPIAIVGLGYFGYRLVYQFQHLNNNNIKEPPAEFGTIAQVGHVLFTDYLFVFEAVSVLLLIAVVAAVVVARQHHKGEEPAHTDGNGAPVDAHAAHSDGGH
jgi:NADH-quinone oxidoreductase subunit J